jgi:cytochrome c-type biogenesis protein CcmH
VALFGLMTAAAIFAVLWPLGRARAPQGAGNDIAVYRDQLDEIGATAPPGLIGEAEAEAARVEVSRRLIAAADPIDELPRGHTFRRRVAGLPR